MSRRKQTKPHHRHSDSEEERPPASRQEGKLGGGRGSTTPSDHSELPALTPLAPVARTYSPGPLDLGGLSQLEQAENWGQDRSHEKESLRGQQNIHKAESDNVVTHNLVSPNHSDVRSKACREPVTTKISLTQKSITGAPFVEESVSVKDCSTDITLSEKVKGMIASDTATDDQRRESIIKAAKDFINPLHRHLPDGFNTASESSHTRPLSAEICKPLKKRGRPPTLSLVGAGELSSPLKSHATIAKALALAAQTSPRRHSSRLLQASPLAVSPDLGGYMGVYTRKLSHRTCEYCGIVAATPAALQRHIRKHTGERPFVCQVCHKAYKAKRSLHCHQLSNHPQIVSQSCTSDLDMSKLSSKFSASMSGVSANTSHLLREKIESRQGGLETEGGGMDLRTAVPHFSQLLPTGCDSARDPEDVEDKFAATDVSHSPTNSDHLKRSLSTDNTHDLGINVSTLNFSPEDGKQEREDPAIRNSCPVCFKAFGKPSDLRRHLLSHTSIRPYTCQVCNKAFRQVGSLNYHLRVAHQLNVPLSQGLEARAHLRLKRLMGSAEGLQETGLECTATTSPDTPDIKPLAGESAERELPAPCHSLTLPPFLTTCSPTSLQDFRKGLLRQASLASGETSSLPHDRDHDDRECGRDGAKRSNIVDFELPPLLGYNGMASPEDLTGSGSRGLKVELAVKGETELFTLLDGICATTGRHMQVFRCGLCRKIQASLFIAVSHLATHFDPKGLICSPFVPAFSPPLSSSSSSTSVLECSRCQLAFASKSEMAVHFLHKHHTTFNDLDFQNNNHRSFSVHVDEEKETEANHKVKDRLDLQFARLDLQFSDDHNNNSECKPADSYDNTIAQSSLGDYSPVSPRSKAACRLVGSDGEEVKIGADAGSVSLEVSPTYSAAHDRCLSLGENCMDQTLYSGKGAYRCPKCCKCYLTSFLLDRHMKFHQRQSVIEKAMKSGAVINGTHKNLLLNPPPVLIQNADKFFHELSSEVRTPQGEEKGQGFDSIYCAGTTNKDCRPKSVIDDELSREDKLQRQKTDAVNSMKINTVQAVEADNLAHQESVQEDVVVVMPSDPEPDLVKPGQFDIEESCGVSIERPTEYDPDRSSLDSQVSPSQDNVDIDSDTFESKIRTSPRKRLIPYNKDGLPASKSRRKSSLPTRFKSRDLDGKVSSCLSENAEMPLALKQLKHQEQFSASSLLQQQQWEPNEDVESDASSPSESLPIQTSQSVLSPALLNSHCPQQPQLGSPGLTAGSSERNEKSSDLEFERDLLRTQQQQPSYLHNIHAAFGAPSLFSSRLTGNGLAAMAGYLHHFPPALPAVVSPFGLHASSSSFLSSPLPLSLPPPLSSSPPHPSPQSKDTDEDVAEEAEDLSIANTATASKALTPSSDLILTSRSDGLMGCQGAGWDSSSPAESEGSFSNINTSKEMPGNGSTFQAFDADAAASHGSQRDGPIGRPSERFDFSSRTEEAEREEMGEESRSPLSESGSGTNEQPMRTVWHMLSSDDLKGPPASADGRKVTSLSRTHSRLYVVSQPVDREQLCKPTLLPDGRTVFKCYFCHKDFLSYSDINRHMDFHEDIRPYKCNFCEYYARTNSQLKVHMMRHQGIRGFCCRLCNYRGVTQSDLNRHMKSQIHLLKSGNECMKCGEGFVTARNLEKHASGGCDGQHKMDVDGSK